MIRRPPGEWLDARNADNRRPHRPSRRARKRRAAPLARPLCACRVPIWVLSARHNTSVNANCPIIGLEGLLGLLGAVERLGESRLAQTVGEEGQRCPREKRLPPVSEQRRAGTAVAQAASDQPQTPAVADEPAPGAPARAEHASAGAKR